MSKELQTRQETSIGETFNTKTVVKKLESYMDKVTENECTPATVQAAVNCADKIVDILRLHLDVERLKVRRI